MSTSVPLEILRCSEGSPSDMTPLFMVPFNSPNKSRIEYWWGLECDEMDLNTPLNILHLRTDMVQMLRERRFILVPTESTLNMMEEMQSTQRNRPLNQRQLFTDLLPEKEYEYIFIPLKRPDNMPPLFIQRTDQPLYERFDYPYANLPRFRCSTHPFFLVHGMFSTMVFPEVPPPSTIRSLIRSLGLYWASSPPKEFYYLPTYVTTLDPPDDDDDDSSDEDELSYEDASKLCDKVSLWSQQCHPEQSDNGVSGVSNQSHHQEHSFTSAGTPVC